MNTRSHTTDSRAHAYKFTSTTTTYNHTLLQFPSPKKNTIALYAYKHNEKKTVQFMVYTSLVDVYPLLDIYDAVRLARLLKENQQL